MSKRKDSIKQFLDSNGRIKQLPVPNRTKVPVLGYLAGKFKKGETYKEKEVNEIIEEWHSFNDYFVLRRALVDYGFINRTNDGSKYLLNENGEE
ncbi:MAG TPA: DUF2087 domain-containing protein [Clostridia bacterium]|nr:DUF2087 domain-containing protein [Clostridia bacterium]